MAAKGSHIDFMFLAPLPPPLTRPLDPLLRMVIAKELWTLHGKK